MLSQEEFDFIKNNISEDPRSLAFKTHGKFTDSMGFLLNQIKLKQKAKKKLPEWSSNHRLLFPTSVSYEQCSSRITAEHKSTLVSGTTVIDISGGLGIDTISFSNKFQKTIHIEFNPEIQKYCSHNFKELKRTNITSLYGDGLEFIKNSSDYYDVIYVDPDRRPDLVRANELDECIPNVITWLDILLEKCNTLFIKASPMCDIKKSVRELKYVSEIHIISHKNECKEVLFLVQKSNTELPRLTATELSSKNTSLTINYTEETLQKETLDAKKYIYDPFVSFRKAKMSFNLSETYKTNPIGVEGTLLTSENLHLEFPGRVFEKIGETEIDKKKLAKAGVKKANVISRGFHMKADEIAKKMKIKDGGDIFLIAYQTRNKKGRILICKRLK